MSPESLTAGLRLPSLAPDVSRGSLDQLKRGVRQPPTQTLLPGALRSQSAQPEHSQPPTALQGTCCHLPARAPCPPRAPPASLAPAALGPGTLPHAICAASHLPVLSQMSFSRRGRLAILPEPWSFPACTPARLPTHSISEHTKPSTDVSTGLIVHLSPPESQLSKKRDLWIFAPLCIPRPMLKNDA